MKKFLKYISLAIALTVAPYQANAEPLRSYERQLYEAFTRYPEQREAIALSFWKHTADEIKALGEFMPLPAGPFSEFFMIQFNPGLIVYHIKIKSKHWDKVLPERSQVVNHLCNDERAILLLVVFGGTLTYKSYRGNTASPQNTITITGSDCSPGI
jgi:hypothetical protein